MNINVDERVYVKSDNPTDGDIFVVVHKNHHQTPYMLSRDGLLYRLTNLHSGYISYTESSIEEVIEKYISNKRNNINPIVSYFFIKGYNSKINLTETFGYKRVDS